MDITDFADAKPWAIRQGALDALAEKFKGFRGESPEIEAAIRLAVTSTPDEYQVVNGVAIMPISGPITKQASFFSAIFGMTALDDLQVQFNQALNDPDVQAIVLDVNSPGGTVSGVDALSQMIYSARGDKPIIAFADGCMASAAYWLGSAADIIVAEKTAIVGSIGTLTMHKDLSEADKLAGVKRTYIASGKFKALANDAEPLGLDGRQMLQDMTDYLYAIFVEAVAKNRGVPVETVVENMADGRDFVGQQAVDAGLADTIGTMDTAIGLALAMVDENRNQKNAIRKESASMDKTKILAILGLGKDQPVTAEALMAGFPEPMKEIITAAHAEGVKSIDVEAQKKTAVDARITEIMALAVAFFGEANGDKFKNLLTAGVTPEQVKSLGIIPIAAGDSDAEAKRKEELLAAIKAAGTGNPGAGDGSSAGSPDFTALVNAYQTEHKCTRSEAIKATANAHPEAHQDYIRLVNTKQKEK
jgi:signal peptide peptidase SppA